MATNFKYAPQSKLVDGLQAVPIDIQHLDASLIFDSATEICNVDATIEFIVGPDNGNPIFDLRQTISSAWLDGVAFDIAKLAHHDFGGGTDADMRILESVLVSGSNHTLRLQYQLALPDAPNSSSGPPTYDWNSGRLNLKFWYTDLKPGRYLDAWLPGNLLFDQFTVNLDIQIVGSGITHTLITNGTTVDLGANHWQVLFPDHFSVCSGMLRIHPSDEIESLDGSATLPSGDVIEINTFKFVVSSTNLASGITQIATNLSNFETSSGPYAHGNRIIVFFESATGGMEYAGATKTSTGLLAHETYHSWWGRGIQPASQNDGWWDEGWTTYITNGYSPMPFNYADAPVELSSQNQWIRQTSGASYTDGRKLFQGIASLIGDSNLRDLMRQFYEERMNGLATTLELESFLISKSGESSLVDAFHRFVYGFNDPSPHPNLWMRDDPSHTGGEAWGGTFWDSPDLWIRNDDDDLATHEPPRELSDNWFYARVRNQGGIARHFIVAFHVRQWAGTQFVYPNDFLPCISATGGFDLEPYETRVVKAQWPAAQVPPAGTHGCLLAAVIARDDHPIGGLHIWEDNNLAQKNLTVAELDSDGWIVVPLLVGSRFNRDRSAFLELWRPRGHSRLRATILYPAKTKQSIGKTDLIDCGGLRKAAKREYPLHVWTDKSDKVYARSYFQEAREVKLKTGRVTRWKISSKTGFPVLIGLRLEAPKNAKPGSSIHVDLVQRDKKNRIVGGIAVLLNIR